mgnify:CR=1 FL=1
MDGRHSSARLHHVQMAIGIRLKAGNLQTVNEALAKGDILRIHVMRPTWHYVAAEDIRWMLKLSSRRIITANDSFAKSRGQDISVDIYNKAKPIIGKGTSRTQSSDQARN